MPFRRVKAVPYLNRLIAAVCVSSALVVLLKIVLSSYYDTENAAAGSPPESIIFPWRVTSTKSGAPFPAYVRRLPRALSQVSLSPDYGYLTFDAFGNSAGVRDDDYDQYELYRDERMEAMRAMYPNMPLKLWHDDEIVGGPKQCYRNNWGRAVKPICNYFHEMHMDIPWSKNEDADKDVHQDFDYILKAKGSFVHVWLMVRPGTKDFMALKRYKLNDHFPLNIKDILNVQTEAVVMERLTSSDRIMDIYGYCGFDTLIEGALGELSEEIMPSGGYVSQELLDTFQPVDVMPLNNLTLMDKLDTAILMSESIAELHGFEGGAIAHGDIYPSQWLRTLDGKLKLNDFNSAEIMDWDPWNQKYCTFGRCHLNWNRAPEDLTCGKWPADQGIDTYCMGNNIYTLLTGLWSFYWNAENHEPEVMQAVLEGNRTYIDPRYRTRSAVESKLVELMEETWVQNIEERISIFEILQRLHEIKALYEEELKRARVV